MKLDQEKKEKIIELVKRHSISEVALKVGCGVVSVSKVIKEYNIQRSKEDLAAIRSRVRTDLVRAERRRAIFGLDQKSNLKVFSNKDRNKLKYCLKRKGYSFPERGVNIAYITKNTVRDLGYEEKGRKLGIQFYIEQENISI